MFWGLHFYFSKNLPSESGGMSVSYDENKRFILEWYKFIKALTFRLKFVRDEEEIKAINKILLVV